MLLFSLKLINCFFTCQCSTNGVQRGYSQILTVLVDFYNSPMCESIGIAVACKHGSKQVRVFYVNCYLKLYYFSDNSAHEKL